MERGRPARREQDYELRSRRYPWSFAHINSFLAHPKRRGMGHPPNSPNLRQTSNHASKRAIDRSDHLIEEIKTDDKAAMQRVIIEEWKRERETSLCGPPEFVLMTPLSSFRSSFPSLFPRPIMLSSLSLKPQNKMSPSGMAGGRGRSGGPP